MRALLVDISDRAHPKISPAPVTTDTLWEEVNASERRGTQQLFLGPSETFSLTNQVRRRGEEQVIVGLRVGGDSRLVDPQMASAASKGIFSAFVRYRKAMKHIKGGLLAVVGTGIVVGGGKAVWSTRNATEASTEETAGPEDDSTCLSRVHVVQDARDLTTLVSRSENTLFVRSTQLSEDDTENMKGQWEQWARRVVTQELDKASFKWELVPTTECSPSGLELGKELGPSVHAARLDNTDVTVFRYDHCLAAAEDLDAFLRIGNAKVDIVFDVKGISMERYRERVLADILGSFFCLETRRFTLIRQRLSGTLWDFLDKDIKGTFHSSDLKNLVKQLFAIVKTVHNITLHGLDPTSFMYVYQGHSSPISVFLVRVRVQKSARNSNKRTFGDSLLAHLLFWRLTDRIDKNRWSEIPLGDLPPDPTKAFARLRKSTHDKWNTKNYDAWFNIEWDNAISP
jgi:hypothetical protein